MASYCEAEEHFAEISYGRNWDLYQDTEAEEGQINLGWKNQLGA